jgi:hypothetical protein
MPSSVRNVPITSVAIVSPFSLLPNHRGEGAFGAWRDSVLRSNHSLARRPRNGEPLLGLKVTSYAIAHVDYSGAETARFKEFEIPS